MVNVANGRIEYDITNPDIIEIDGSGRVEYFEFEDTIWVWGIYSSMRGKGNLLARKMIEYAKGVNKDIYCRALSDGGDGSLSTKRLMRWYTLMGLKPIKMRNNPTAMKLEIRK